MAQQRLQLNLTANTSGFTGALNTASSKLQKFGGKLKSIGGSMQKFALPLALAGGASVKMALDFDKSMTKIKALVGIAGGEVDKMGQKVKELARDTGVSSREAAEALFFITSAGLEGDSAMNALEMSLKGAASGLGETKNVADLATSAMNAYGDSGLTAEKATDVLTAAVREGKLEASELASSMGAVIPIASNMGVSFDQVGAAMAAMSRTGTNAAVGATQLTAILASLKKPTSEAEKALASMGLSTEGVQKSLAEEGLMSTLEMLKNKTTEFGVNITDIFPNIRALKGVLDLTGAGMEDAKKIFDELANSAGSTAEAFRITEESASFQFQKSLNSAKETLMSLGQQLLVAVVPAVQKLAGFIQNLYKRFTELDPTMQKLILAFGGLAIALPTIITLVGSLISLFGALLSPATLIIAAVTGIAFAFYKYWGQIKTIIVNVINWFIKLYNESLLIRGAVELIGAVFKSVFDFITISLKTGWKNFKAFGKMVWDLFKNVGDIIMGVFTLDWDKFKEGISGAAKSIGDGVSEIFENTSDGADEIGNKLAENVVKGFRNTMDNTDVKEVTEGMFDGIEDLAKDVKNKIVGVFSGGGGSGSSGGGGSGSSGGDDGSGGSNPFANLNKKLASGGDDNKKIEERITLLEKLGWTADSTAQSLQASFSHLGNSIVESMGVAGTALGEFLSTFMNMVTEYLAGQLQMMLADSQKATNKNTTDAMQMASDSALTAVLGANAAAKISTSGGASVGNAVEGATQSAKGFGAAAAFVLPALIAMAVGAVSSAMKKTKKFAKGGIISAPTMGLMGEYPGAKSNPEVVAPLDRLKGLIGSNNRAQQVNVGGSFELRGQDLVVALERANSTRDRIL
ncbi:MAG: putative minor tail protein [Prokaryotic dsDNA virus sp.]|nr:MAG: putative minor tail protein [Prokaryotic dsDNA virus sp.]|tara:strand:+ start:1420 stop:3999 length:2580 start_codon:yes stop_codon:yes gene_type:complete